MTHGSKSKKASASCHRDRISALPDEVLQHILGFLPADEAVQSCVLARRWRRLWKPTPVLRVIEPRRWGSAGEFNKFVSHLLLFRDPSPLDECEFKSYPYSNRVGIDRIYRNRKESHRYVDMWIRCALDCKVRMLRLRILGTDYCTQRYLPLVLPHLTRLELAGLKIKKKFLDLSGCPLLQNLKFGGCSLDGVKKVSSSSLKRLSLTRCKFSVRWRTRVYVPGLVPLRLDDFDGRTPVLQSMPLLQAAFVKLTYNEDHCDDAYNYGTSEDNHCDGCRRKEGDTSDCVLLKGLSEAENLELLAACNMFIFKRDLRWCPTFSKLNTLVLNDWCMATDFHALACILQHSPLLQKFTLKFSKFLCCRNHNIQRNRLA